MMAATDCMPCILSDLKLGVITTSSVYCDHKQNKNKQTNIELQNKKANEKMTDRNVKKLFSYDTDLGPLDAESWA